MEWIAQKDSVLESFKRFRYVLLAALAGIILMTMPEKKDVEPVVQTETTEKDMDLESTLCQILSNVSGAGRVEVLLTEQEGERTFYQCNEDTSSLERHTETVLVTGSDRNESGLILRIDPPIYRGALVICQGAENAQVRLSIVEAVKSVTGLSSNHITVLKMK